jgi:hypothetical protein
MAAKFEIVVTDNNDNSERVSTGGYALIYLEGADQIKVKGNIDTKALMPIITKIMMEKLSGKNSG